ncbi:MAG TPA: hypothetical protein VH083_14845 [Myxococcales bacterium]|nr:hypothetical protein [Myxococcales bacterium]
MNPALISALGVVGVGWLWFLMRGKARGTAKRLALRLTLLAVVGGLVAAAERRGIFARASLGFKLALLMALLVVVVGYLYLIRFCDSCGRMERDFKAIRCKRCQSLLPINGMSTRLRREDSGARWDPLAKRRG